jgi:hypothetical protein
VEKVMQNVCRVGVKMSFNLQSPYMLYTVIHYLFICLAYLPTYLLTGPIIEDTKVVKVMQKIDE